MRAMDDPLQEGKERLQAEREARDQERLAADSRRKRGIGLFAAGGTIAVVAVVALILLGGSGDDRAPAPQAKGLIAGIPQAGTVLGDPDAPVTVVEFVDLQCPFCRDYSLEALPGVIKRYVRTGKVKLDLRVLSFLGPDSEAAGRLAYGASRQNRLWQFTEQFFRDQGEENSGYATEKFLRAVGSKVDGLKLEPALTASRTSAADDFLEQASADAKRYEVESTPGFVALKDGEEPQPLKVEQLTAEEFAAQIDPILK